MNFNESAPHEQFDYDALPFIPDSYITEADKMLDADDEYRMRTKEDAVDDPISPYFGNREVQAGIIAQEKAAFRIHKEMPFTYDALVTSEQIRPVTVRTPLEPGNDMFPEAEFPIWFKREDLQLNGSFKTRGSAKFLTDLTPEKREAGVVLASAGNASSGMAGAAQRWGIPLKVIMSETASELKADRCREKGAEVVRYGKTYDHAEAYAAYLAGDNLDIVLGHAFESEPVMTGQSTHMVEILEERPDIMHAFMAGGGGGLVAKSAAILREFNPRASVVCSQLEGSDALYQSWLAGHPVEIDNVNQWSDGTAVALPGLSTVGYACENVSEFSIVTQADAALEMKLFRELHGDLIETAPGLALAALRKYVPLLKGPVVVTISGGNISLADWELKTVPAREMAAVA